MADTQLNPQILEAVRDLTKNDAATRKFIIEMLFEEHKHPGQWWFKDPYRTSIRKYSRSWSSGE